MLFSLFQAYESRYSTQGKIPRVLKHSILSKTENEDGSKCTVERECHIELPTALKPFVSLLLQVKYIKDGIIST